MLKKTFSFGNMFLKRGAQSTASMEKIQEKFVVPKRYATNEKSVWNEYLQLAVKYKPINLGEGFPDFAPPSFLTDALVEVVCGGDSSFHQYTRGFGHIRLVLALSKLYSKLVCREIDPFKEIIVTVGGCEALFCSIQGNINDCDEVIIIEPFFECYEPMVKSAGGIPRFVALKQTNSCDSISSADFVLDSNELEGMFNKNTKAIILTNPNNPLGKVYTQEELQTIADLCIKWDVMCIADEVYEWLVFEPFKHVRIATLPGMWERTVTIGTAGKTFCATGWKIGWAFGPRNLIANLQTVHQGSVHNCATPTQEALARNIEREVAQLDDDSSHLNSLACESQIKRDFMYVFLNDVGMKPIVPHGGYFVVADWSPLESQVDLSTEKDEYKDYRFTKWMVKNVGVQGIPISAFYSRPHKNLGENYVRYCFIKKDELLQKAADVLKKWKSNKK